MKNTEMFERAKKVMPGGVNSPVRAFTSIGVDPLFIKRAEGSKIYDIDGNEYIDYVSSWGPMILGHNNQPILESIIAAAKEGLSFGAPTENEVLMAELITSIVPNVYMIRMVNSGTEAVMSALRLARGYTKKKKVIKFEGCYHGHCDSMLVKAGSGVLNLASPDSLGVTDGAAKDTLVAVYNDIDSVEKLFRENENEVACLIIEPVAANMGVVPPKEDFLIKIRELCDKYNTLLIFDEVITGFRLGIGGAQEYYGINADLVTYGKIIGGGMPVGAYGGKKEIMEMIAPLGGVYQAGTLSGNPIAMAAGLQQIRILNENKTIYRKIEEMAKKLEEGFINISKELELDICVNRVGSLVGVFFTNEKVDNFIKAKTSDTKRYAEYFKMMLKKGVYLAPAQFEAMFVGYSHTEGDIEKTLSAAKDVLIEIKRKEGI